MCAHSDCASASSVILSVQLCVFVGITPERHKRLMFCQESTDGIVRDCVPQSCDQALCVCVCVCMCAGLCRSKTVTAVLPKCCAQSLRVNFSQIISVINICVCVSLGGSVCDKVCL